MFSTLCCRLRRCPLRLSCVRLWSLAISEQYHGVALDALAAGHYVVGHLTNSPWTDVSSGGSSSIVETDRSGVYVPSCCSGSKWVMLVDGFIVLLAAD